MIYVIGNSHCNFFTKSPPSNDSIIVGEFFTSIPMWGIIAYNYYEHHMESTIKKLNNLSIAYKNQTQVGKKPLCQIYGHWIYRYSFGI